VGEDASNLRGWDRAIWKWSGPGACQHENERAYRDAAEIAYAPGWARDVLRGQSLLVLGDSLQRYQFLALAHLLKFGRWPRALTPATKASLRDDGTTSANALLSALGESNMLWEGEFAASVGKDWSKGLYRGIQLAFGGVDGQRAVCDCDHDPNREVIYIRMPELELSLTFVFVRDILSSVGGGDLRCGCAPGPNATAKHEPPRELSSTPLQCRKSRYSPSTLEGLMAVMQQTVAPTIALVSFGWPNTHQADSNRQRSALCTVARFTKGSIWLRPSPPRSLDTQFLGQVQREMDQREKDANRGKRKTNAPAPNASAHYHHDDGVIASIESSARTELPWAEPDQALPSRFRMHNAYAVVHSLRQTSAGHDEWPYYEVFPDGMHLQPYVSAELSALFLNQLAAEPH